VSDDMIACTGDVEPCSRHPVPRGWWPVRAACGRVGPPARPAGACAVQLLHV